MKCSPLEVLAGWPTDRPVVMLHSGAGPGAGGSPDPAPKRPAAATSGRRWSRWSILSTPDRWITFDPPAPSGDRRRGGARSAEDPLHALTAALEATHLETGHAADPTAVPFLGGWIGFLSYELGRVIEPAARGGRERPDDRRWPLIQFARCGSALIFDHAAGTWYGVGPGDPAAGLRPDCGVSGRLDGDPVTVTGWTSSLTADGYLAAVRRTLEHIAAGDIFQANITQRLSADFRGGPRRLAARALARSAAGYGAYLELPGGRHIVSMSPELFLEVVPDACGGRRVVTRPIKGTRPAGVAREELRDSPKDAAELHMIVDLMRNDLGRVCAYGSVRVPVARAIETHPTVHHGVGEVTGLLREDAGMSDLLRATFPGGSVTGAPKIRAMQIIEDLEPVPRGPYCGSIGFFSDTGAACLSIAIRTILLTAGDRGGGGRPVRLDYSVGGGVVADSVPGAEYDESLAKAAVLKVVLEDGTRPRSGSLLLRASL